VRKYLKGSQTNGEDRNLPVYVPKQTEFAERELIYRALVDLKTDILDMKNLLASAAGGSTAIVRRDVAGSAELHGGTVVHQRPAEDENVSLEEMERRMIIGSLQKYEGNRRLAAHALKISERTLYRKIKEYGLQ